MPGQRNRMNKGTAVWKRAACEGNLVVLCSLYRMDQSLKSPHYEVPLYTNIGTLSFIYQVPRNQQSFELGSEPVCCAVISCSVMQLLCHPTLCNPIDCSPPDSFVHGGSPGTCTGVGCHALLQGIYPAQGSNQGCPHCRWIIYHLSHHESLWMLEWVACPFSRGSSWPRNWTGVSCIAGGFFTNWANREAWTVSQPDLYLKIIAQWAAKWRG